MIVGIDVSQFQVPSDWDTSLVSFVIARATIGTQPDDQYKRHIAKATAAGLVTGAYHFNVGSGVTAAAQAAKFLATAGDVDGYALDVEGKDPFTPDQAREFVDRVQQAGKRIGLYHSESGYPSGAWGADWRWVANWTTTPTIPYDLHQFGPYHKEDGNRFAGTVDQLRTLFTGGSMSLIIANEEPRTATIPVGASVFDLAGTFLYKMTTTATRPVLHAVTIPGMSGTFCIVRLPNAGDPQALLVRASEITLTPVPPPDCQAQIDAAIAADRAKAKVVVSWG